MATNPMKLLVFLAAWLPSAFGGMFYSHSTNCDRQTCPSSNLFAYHYCSGNGCVMMLQGWCFMVIFSLVMMVFCCIVSAIIKCFCSCRRN
uniref:Membrane associated protein n=1 Tax=Panagrellus redivivus TaxID=6233 RepID=A0A7E4UUG6_PANRE